MRQPELYVRKLHLREQLQLRFRHRRVTQYTVADSGQIGSVWVANQRRLRESSWSIAL